MERRSLLRLVNYLNTDKHLKTVKILNLLLSSDGTKDMIQVVRQL